MKAFEARLAALKRRMEAGLTERARVLHDAANRLENGDEDARREIKSQSHKLRGIAGTYGHTQLTDMAAQLEQRASLSPPPIVAELARELATRADEISSAAAEAATAPASSPTTPPLTSTPRPPAPEVLHTPAPRARSSAPGAAPAQGAAPAPGAATTPEQEQRPAGRALRILAMDDDPITLKLLRLTLKQVGGFDATIVESARTALTELAQREFDVVLSDAMMPDMNGLEFCQAARELGGRAGEMPIIILSAATADELGWHRSLDARTSWLRKPFRPSELVQAISQIVEDHESR